MAPWRWLTGSVALACCLGPNCVQVPAVPVDNGQSLQVLSEIPEPPPAVQAISTLPASQHNADRTLIGDKGQWIRRASAALAARFPQVDAFMWFNMDKERDWRVDSSSGSLTAFRESFATLQAGVFLETYPATNAGDTSALDTYEQLVSRRQTRIGWYEALTNYFPVEEINRVQARGSRPYIVWEPYDSRVSGETPYTSRSRLAEIAGGVYDSQILSWARAAAVNGRPIDICFGHEANGDWYAWGYLNAHNGNTPQLYVRAFRHVVDVFDAAGASNVSWVWVVNATWHDDFSEAFPGADYVDRLGINGHNWGGDPAGSDPAWAKWREFEQLFGRWNTSDPRSFNNIQTLAALADRPIMIAEFASAEGAPAKE